MTTFLDWRELAPPPEIHSCDCDFCEENGEWQPINRPSLIRCTVDGAAYISDRFMMLKAYAAPIPVDYEGATLGGPDFDRDDYRAASVLDQPAEGMAFRWHVVKAVEMTGWRLRLLAHPEDATDHAKLAVGVVNAEGEHIGWAMSVKERVDDERNERFTRDYTEVTR